MLGIFVICQKFECIPEIILAIACVPKSVNPFNQGQDLLFTFSRSVFVSANLSHFHIYFFFTLYVLTSLCVIFAFACIMKRPLKSINRFSHEILSSLI